MVAHTWHWWRVQNAEDHAHFDVSCAFGAVCAFCHHLLPIAAPSDPPNGPNALQMINRHSQHQKECGACLHFRLLSKHCQHWAQAGQPHFQHQQCLLPITNPGTFWRQFKTAFLLQLLSLRVPKGSFGVTWLQLCVSGAVFDNVEHTPHSGFSMTAPVAFSTVHHADSPIWDPVIWCPTPKCDTMLICMSCNDHCWLQVALWKFGFCHPKASLFAYQMSPLWMAFAQSKVLAVLLCHNKDNTNLVQRHNCLDFSTFCGWCCFTKHLLFLDMHLNQKTNKKAISHVTQIHDGQLFKKNSWSWLLLVILSPGKNQNLCFICILAQEVQMIDNWHEAFHCDVLCCTFNLKCYQLNDCGFIVNFTTTTLTGHHQPWQRCFGCTQRCRSLIKCSLFGKCPFGFWSMISLKLNTEHR